MTISARVGLPGSGKSYDTVEHVILAAVKNGRHVWTNIPLVVEEWEAQLPGCTPQLHSFEVETIKDNPQWFIDTLPPGVVFVLDEVWELWPAGTKADQIPDAYKTFIAKHRHMVGDDGFSTEIHLVTQSLEDIATFARNKVDWTVLTTKLDAVGADKRYRVDLHKGMLKGVKPVESIKTRSITGRKYDPKVYALYRSHTMSDSGAAGIETKTDKRASIWGSPMFKFGIPVGACLLAYCIWSILGFFTSASEPKKTAAQTAHPAINGTPAKQGAQPSKRSAPKPPGLSSDWRLAGVFTINGEKRIFLRGRKGASRVITATHCKTFTDTGEDYCYIDGQKVTSWSAPSTFANSQPSGLSALVPAS
jgi:zona occludens toxin